MRKPPHKPFPVYFRETHVKFSRFFARIFARTDLTLPQYALLSLIATQGRLTMTEAGEKLAISKPAVTHLVDRLEASGCLRRAGDPKDRRISFLEIQPRGKRVVHKMQGRALALFAHALARFGAEERKTIARFYEHLSGTLEKALTEAGKK